MRVFALLLLLLAVPSVVRAETNACTTIQSIPVTISTPGSYCLHSDLTSSVAVTANMIFVAQTSDVTLDCNGHHLTGVVLDGSNAESFDYYGIKVGSSTRVTVRNCNVHGFRNGIIVHRFADGYERSRDVVLENNLVDRSVYGIYISSEGASRVTRNLVRETLKRGIEVYAAPGQTQVSHNTVVATGNGIVVGEAGVFSQLGGWLIVDSNTFSDTVGNASAGSSAVRLDTFAGTGFSFSNNRIMNAPPGPGVEKGISNPGGYPCTGNVFAGFGASLPTDCAAPTNLAY